MIKLPKQVKEILNKLSQNGYSAYTVGGCVRDSLLGLKPLDWDITTNADYKALKEMFPDAHTLSGKFSVIRLFCEKTDDEELIVDIATFRKDGIYSDGRKPDDVEFVKTIEEDLPRRDFTINAMADSGAEFKDMYNGKDDVAKRLIRTIGDPDERFREDPIRMLRAIRFVSELDFDLTKDVYEAIKRNYNLIERASADRIRREFVGIMGGKAGGKGLNMLLDIGIMKFILGEDGFRKLTHREKTDLLTLCKNMHKSKNVAERRLGAFYSIISQKKALDSIELLGFDGELKQNLEDVVYDLNAFHFAQTDLQFKRFMYEHAPVSRTLYLLNLQKAQMLIFEFGIETKVKSKMYLLDEFKKQGCPIFIEDLAVDANDLIEADIYDTVNEAEDMCYKLLERTHLYPEVNNRKDLLELAAKYKKNKLACLTRGIKWAR